MRSGGSTMKIDLLSRAQLSIINKNSLRYPLAIAEKDYFLAVVLQIIYSSKLKDSLVFKGGTAIHHLYLAQLRFSEDLAFQTNGKITEDDLRDVFEPYDFLEILKSYQSDFTLKIKRLKFTGPLGQPNSIKLDVDLTQELILPAEKAEYKNVYGVPVTVSAMAVKEIYAEKVRAVNERARYRDFYDLAMMTRPKDFEPEEILEILKRKELRKPLSKDSVLENLEVAEEAKRSGAESLFYRQETNEGEMKETLNGILELIAERRWRELRRYASQRAKEMGIISEKDIDRIIHELRAERGAGENYGGMSEKEIDQLIREMKGN